MKSCCRYPGFIIQAAAFPTQFFTLSFLPMCMRPILRLIAAFLFIHTFAQAQTGCPGCLVQVPVGLATDTIYLPNFPDGQQGVPYDKDYSFRMPKTTTPVAAIDSTTPAGLPISKIEILGLSGLPDGLSWQPNAWIFDPSTQSDGCIKICGIPQQADSFTLMVKVKVTVFVINRETEFPLRLYIAPKVSITEGFSMTNFIGCGNAVTTFTNNVPSKSKPGYSYAWNFGDSTSFSGEKPPPHTYNTPGTYVVSYRAIIDTVGYVLQSATVLSVDCVDQLGVGSPDLYLFVKSPSSALIYDSSPDINNTPLPYTFPLNIPLFSGNYTLEVWDEDSGVKGGDDPCGNVSFNILSNDTIVSGGFRVVFKIIHPVDTIYSTDTVIVYPLPIKPTLSAPKGFERCSNNNIQLTLISSALEHNQWFLNGEKLEGDTTNVITPNETGYYQVAVSNANGCKSISDSVLIQIYPAPEAPIYFNNNNLLLLSDTATLPDQYQLQWFNNATLILGENGIRYCATSDGTYGVQVTDLSSLCTAYYASTIDYDPNFDCTVGVQSIQNEPLAIYPNPTQDAVSVRLPPQANLQNATISIWDYTGKLMLLQNILPNSSVTELQTAQLNAGLYQVVFRSAEGNRYIGKLAIMK